MNQLPSYNPTLLTLLKSGAEVSYNGYYLQKVDTNSFKMTWFNPLFDGVAVFDMSRDGLELAISRIELDMTMGVG